MPHPNFIQTMVFFALLAGCSRPHPLAEWEPDKFAPASPTESWSTDWWPATDSPAPARTMEAINIPIGNTLSLAGSVDVALQANPETRLAWADARAAAAEYGISRGDWYPTLTAWAEAIFERELFPLGGETNLQRVDIFTGGPGATLTWTLLDFGRRDASDDEMARALLAANLRFNRSLQDVVFNVQKHYFALEAADGMREAAKLAFVLSNSILEQVEEQLILGLATAPDVLAASQAQALAGYEVAVTKTNVHNARTDLLVTMGLPPDTTVAFDFSVDTALPSELEIGVEQLAELAMASRPDLAAAAAMVQAADARIRAAEATLNPQVTVSATAGYLYSDYKLNPYYDPGPNSGDGWVPTWNVGLTGSWMLFDGEIRHNEIRLAKAEHHAAEEALRRIQLNVAGEVWDAYFDYKAAVERLAWADRLSISAKENLNAMRAAFDHGLKTLPDLQVAQQQIAAARAIRIQSRSDVLTAAAAMVHATG